MLRHGGNIIVTMGNPPAEIAVHQVVWLVDRLFKTQYDMDSERGMNEEEEYYLTDSGIVERLTRAGFKRISKKYFRTQWGLNHLLIGWKERAPAQDAQQPSGQRARGSGAAPPRSPA